MFCLPITEVKSSGAELPAAMNVAPATSSLSWRRLKRREGRKSQGLWCHYTASAISCGIFSPRISSPVRARSNHHKPEPEHKTCRRPAGERQDTWVLILPVLVLKLQSTFLGTLKKLHNGGGDSFRFPVLVKFDGAWEKEQVMGNTWRLQRRSGDTYTEDMQAHCSLNALLIGEVILGELMNRCGGNTQMNWLYYSCTVVFDLWYK